QPGGLWVCDRRRAAGDLPRADRPLSLARDEGGAMIVRTPLSSRRVLLHTFLIAMVLVWLFPLAWAIYASLRPISDTIRNGYVSLPASLGLSNYEAVWTEANMPHFYLNTLFFVVPAVILTLALPSVVS